MSRIPVFAARSSVPGMCHPMCALTPNGRETTVTGRRNENPVPAPTALAAVVLAAMSTAAHSAVINVPADFPTIQQAIKAAADGDEIVVAPDVYNETIDLLGKAINLHSSDGADVTIIDGTGLNDTVVKCVAGEGPDTVLEGFTITGGIGLFGGGMNNSNSGPTVTNCTFSGNIAEFGGGMFISASSPTVSGCTFTGNSAEVHGGGLYSNQTSVAIMIDCTFSNNCAVVDGGGMYSLSDTTALTRCTFIENDSGDDAGGFEILGSNGPALVDCMFLFNTAGDEGGGGRFVDCVNPVMSNCDFQGNIALSGSGGGMRVNGSTNLTVSDSSFLSNSASNKGGGMRIFGNQNPRVDNCSFLSNTSGDDGGGLHLDESSNSVVVNCIFTDNTSHDNGGGLEIENGTDVTVSDCTFTGNEADDNGGGLLIELSSRPTVTSCTIIGNTAGNDGGGLRVGTSTFDAIVTNCTISENIALDDGGGLYIGSAFDMIVSGCTFSLNAAADKAGGVYNFAGDRLVLTDCTFSGNLAVVGTGIFNRSGARINGAGVVSGDNQFLNSGTLSPGATAMEGAIGVLTIGTPYTQANPGQPAGALVIDLAGPAQGSEHDQVLFDGEVQLNGGLFLNFTNGFDPPIGGPPLNIINSTDSLSGVFDVVFTTGLPPDREVIIEYVTGAGASGSGAVNVIVLSAGETFFGTPASFIVESLPRGTVSEDFNGDTFPDLAMAVPAPFNSVFVVFNNGTDNDGNWIGFDVDFVVQIPVGSSPSAITTARLDRNDSLDLAVTNAGNGTVSILANDGSGQFTVSQTVVVGTNPSAIVAASLNGDPYVDLAVTNLDDGTVTVLINDGSGSFSPAGNPIIVGDEPRAIAAGNFDEDAFVDLAVARLGGDDIDDGGELQSVVVLLLNDGNASFIQGELFATGATTILIDPEDLDNDKCLDMVMANQDSGSVSVLINLGGGSFAPAVSLAVGGTLTSMAAFDLDQDGDRDIVVVVTDPTEGRVIRVLRNDLPMTGGPATFALVDDLVQVQDPVLVLSQDVDQDGAPDLITLNGSTGAGSGAGESSIAVSLNLGCPADITGDGIVFTDDFVAILNAWGTEPTGPPDLDGDGVGITDLLLLLANWGPCP